VKVIISYRSLSTRFLTRFHHLFDNLFRDSAVPFFDEELPENRYYLFGKGGARRFAEEHGVGFLGFPITFFGFRKILYMPALFGICNSSGRKVIIGNRSARRKMVLRNRGKDCRKGDEIVLGNVLIVCCEQSVPFSGVRG